MAVKLQLRRDTTANWSASNPVLAEGEIGIDTTLQQAKIGDGVTAWNSLAYGLSGTSVADGTITNPKLADVATSTLKGRITAGTGDPEDLTPAQVLTLLNLREKLAAARTYYVRTDGSNSNTGLADTSGGAFLTIQKAIDVIADTLDLGNYDVTVQVADGTYTGAVRFKTYLAAGGKVTLQGNTGTPANVLISTTGAHAFAANSAGVIANYVVNGFKITTTTSGHSLTANARGLSIDFLNLDFGACAFYQVYANGGRIVATGNFTVSGGALIGIEAGRHGSVDVSNRTITYSGTPAFSSYNFSGVELGEIVCTGITFVGSATGQRYSAVMNGVIFTNGGGASYIPGSTAGATATGGQYV
jgi:hypothetical protein